MRNTLILFNVFVIIGALMLVGTAEYQAFAEETIELNLAFGGSPKPFSARGSAFWAKEVERRTGGKVKIALHYGGSLASHREMVKLVGTGAVDIGESVWAPYNPRVFPLHTVSDGPVIWSKRPVALMHAGIQLEKEIPEVEAENTKTNLKRLTWQGAGISNLIVRNKPIRKVEDLNGLQIRTAGKFLQPPLMKAVGAVPVGVPFPQVYDSLQKGMFDGATGTMGLFMGNKLYEVCKYVIEIGFGGDPGQGIMMNLDLYKSLPGDVQQVMMQLYEEWPKIFVEQFAVPDYKRSLEILKKQGVEVIVFPDDELEKWKALRPLEDHVKPWVKATAEGSKLSEERVRAILKRYMELADKYEKIYSDVF
jgi:TRAP-type C4-dicarboxylate transport system substrate-binding protein